VNTATQRGAGRFIAHAIQVANNARDDATSAFRASDEDGLRRAVAKALHAAILAAREILVAAGIPRRDVSFSELILGRAGAELRERGL